MDQRNREQDWTEEDPGQWTKEQAKRDRRFDFAAFLGPDSLEDRVTDVLDGKDVLQEGPVQSDYVPRRAAPGERGRHEAPGQDPEEEELEEDQEPEGEASFDDGLDTQRFDQDGALPPRTAPGEPPAYRQENVSRPNVNDPPPRPKVVVAEPAPRVVVTPEREYPDARNDRGGGGGGKGMKWIMALLISLVVVALVGVAAIALLPGLGGGSAEPQASPGLSGLLRPLPTQAPSTPTPTQAQTPPPTVHHTISVTAGSGGTVTPGGAVDVEDGRDVTFTITPDQGYELGQLLIDGSPVSVQSSYTFSAVERDHTLYAVFQPAQTAPPTAEPTDEPQTEVTPEPQTETGPGPMIPPQDGGT